jgi:hypothetical protein
MRLDFQLIGDSTTSNKRHRGGGERGGNGGYGSGNGSGEEVSSVDFQCYASGGVNTVPPEGRLLKLARSVQSLSRCPSVELSFQG